MRIVLVSDVTEEFPSNTRNKFKLRLAEQLQLQGQWEAALVQFSCGKTAQRVQVELPKVQVTVAKEETKLGDAVKPVLFSTLKTYLNKSSGALMHFYFQRQGGGYVRWHELTLTYDDLGLDYVKNIDHLPITGTMFMQCMLDRLQRKVADFLHEGGGLYFVTDEQIPRMYIPSSDDTADVLFVQESPESVVKPAVQGQVQYSDGTWHNTSNSFAYWKVRRDIAEMYGWITKDSAGKFQLGVNAVPYVTTVNYHIVPFPRATYTGAEFEVFSMLDGKFNPSMRVNWQFKRLNESMSSFLYEAPSTSSDDDDDDDDSGDDGKEKEPVTQVNDKPILIYTDLVERTSVGTQKTNLLQEIPLSANDPFTHFHFEPRHLQWVPLAKTLVETVEVGIFDSAGANVQFPEHSTTKVTIRLRQIGP